MPEAKLGFAECVVAVRKASKFDLMVLTTVLMRGLVERGLLPDELGTVVTHITSAAIASTTSPEDQQKEIQRALKTMPDEAKDFMSQMGFTSD